MLHAALILLMFSTADSLKVKLFNRAHNAYAVLLLQTNTCPVRRQRSSPVQWRNFWKFKPLCWAVMLSQLRPSACRCFNTHCTGNFRNLLAAFDCALPSRPVKATACAHHQQLPSVFCLSIQPGIEALDRALQFMLAWLTSTVIACFDAC